MVSSGDRKNPVVAETTMGCWSKDRTLEKKLSCGSPCEREDSPDAFGEINFGLASPKMTCSADSVSKKYASWFYCGESCDISRNWEVPTPRFENDPIGCWSKDANVLSKYSCANECALNGENYYWCNATKNSKKHGADWFYCGETCKASAHLLMDEESLFDGNASGAAALFAMYFV